MKKSASDPRGTGAEPTLDVYGPAMQRLVEIATRVAPLESTVLIVGESGVGKERFARLIHRASARAAAPFVAVNCGAVPEGLFESELFGHARGAFTGSLHERQGLFEAADGGTLLLDEAGDVPLPMQVKLLRVLQEREVRRIGENRSRRVSVRVIAATNRNLAQDVAQQRFRLDLFYRLKVVELHIPPLRERPDDLRGLANALLSRIARQMQRPITGYTTGCLDRMLRYLWPGNVRELENVVERACALACGPLIDVDDLPPELQQIHSLPLDTPPVRRLREVEREYILAVLEHNHGNKSRTAAQLGIGVATLFRKLQRYSKEGIRGAQCAQSDGRR
jgi:two-component system response regulator HydG